MPDPWTLIGWAILAVFAIVFVAVLFALSIIFRAKRRIDAAHAEVERRAAEFDSEYDRTRETIERGGRPAGPKFKL